MTSTTDTYNTIAEARHLLYQSDYKGLLALTSKVDPQNETYINYVQKHLDTMGLMITPRDGKLEMRVRDEYIKHRISADDEHARMEKIIEYVLGGSAKFTLINQETQNRFLFAVKRHYKMKYISYQDAKKTKVEDKFLTVYIMRHKGGVLEMVQIGRLCDTKEKFPFEWKGYVGYAWLSEQQQLGFTAVRWLFDKLKAYVEDPTNANLLPEQVEVWHTGHCGKCGRKLTDLKSLQDGIGPVCVRRIEDGEGIMRPQ
jgi:hypothetical protein